MMLSIGKIKKVRKAETRLKHIKNYIIKAHNEIT